MDIKKEINDLCEEEILPPFMPETRNSHNDTILRLLKSQEFKDLFDAEREDIARKLVDLNVDLSKRLLKDSTSWFKQGVLQILALHLKI